MRPAAGEPDESLAPLLAVGEKRPIARRVLFLEPDFARQQVAQVVAFQAGLMGLALGLGLFLSAALAIASCPHHERVTEQAHRERETDWTLVRALLLGRVFAELPAPGLNLGGVGPQLQESLDQRIGSQDVARRWGCNRRERVVRKTGVEVPDEDGCGTLLRAELDCQVDRLRLVLLDRPAQHPERIVRRVALPHPGDLSLDVFQGP